MAISLLDLYSVNATISLYRLDLKVKGRACAISSLILLQL